MHNDFQREIPYALFFPELIKSTMRGWGAGQLADGMIQETLVGAGGWGGGGHISCWTHRVVHMLLLLFRRRVA